MAAIVKGLDGRAVALCSIYRETRAVVVFLRQLGCLFCMRLASSLNTCVPVLSAAGVKLVVVSLGSVADANEWVKKMDFKGEVFVDDTTERNARKAGEAQAGSTVYSSFQLSRQPGLRNDPRVQHESENAKKSGFESWKPDVLENGDLVFAGDPTQLGGVFVLGPGNVCDYAFRSAYAGQDPDLGQIMEAATGKSKTSDAYIYPSTLAWAQKLGVSQRSSVAPKPLSRDNFLSSVINYANISFEYAMAVGLGLFSLGGLVPLAWHLCLICLVACIGFARWFINRPKRLPAAASIVLRTPQEIDEECFQRDALHCDCGSVLDDIPVVGRQSARRASELYSKGPITAPNLGVFQQVVCFLREFLAKPHPDLGRSGPVCPFVPAALNRDSIYLALVNTDESLHLFKGEERARRVLALQRELVKLVAGMRDVFFKLEPLGKLAQSKTIILIFPNIAECDTSTLVDQVQYMCKEEYVAHGLMLGEFHRFNNAPGLHNPEFFPLRTPFPCLAIRLMVPGDLPFLSLDVYPAELRARFLASFLKNFEGQSMPAEILGQATHCLKAAQFSSAATSAAESASASTSLSSSGALSSFSDSSSCRSSSTPLSFEHKCPIGCPQEEAASTSGNKSTETDLSSSTPDDVEAFRKNGHALIDWIANYRLNCSSLPVRSQVEPGYLRKLIPSQMSQQGEEWDVVMRDFQNYIVPGLTHWESSNFFAYFKPHASFPSVFGDLVSAGVNCMGFSWIASPACTELETITLDWLAQLLHIPDCFLSGGKGGGVIQGSAGEACIVAMLAARAQAWGSNSEVQRHDMLGKFVVYSSDQTHSILQKSCMILGIPTSRLRVLPTTAEDAYGLNPAVLREALKEDTAAGLLPLLVCVTIGTTSSTALDPIPSLVAVVREFSSCWIHVDAAYGGAYAACPEFVYLMDGVKDCDSIVVNAHKKLLTTFDCACMWVKDRTPLLEALSLTPEYLRNQATDSGKVIDYKDWQLPLGRRFRALKLWFVLKSFGIAGIQAHIRNGVSRARQFEGWMREEPMFEIAPVCAMALVCFRLHLPSTSHEEQDALNKLLLDTLNQEAKVFLIHTKLGGRVVLRLAVGGLEHTEAHLWSAWLTIRDAAHRVRDL